MPTFSARSKQALATCDQRLQDIANAAIKIIDFTVICGHRNEAAQNAAVVSGASLTPWPTSKHNAMPSRAMDLAPYPLDWSDWKRFYLLAGVIMGVAAAHGVRLRWGGDWDRDFDLNEEKRPDLPHFELLPIK